MRSEMVHELLVRASYEEGSLENIGNGIDRLLHQNVYTAAFPLHDGPFKTNEATLKMCKRYHALDAYRYRRVPIDQLIISYIARLQVG